MIVTFQCKTCKSKTQYKDVLWLFRKVSNDGWVMCFTQWDKRNKIVFDSEYILEGAEQQW